MGLIIISIVVGLVVSYVIAEEFSVIANRKGYSERKYFWYCFLFGIAGYLMVIALPINNEECSESEYFKEKCNGDGEHKKETKMVGNFPASEFEDGAGIRQCSNCGTCHDSDFKVCPACKYQYK